MKNQKIVIIIIIVIVVAAAVGYYFYYKNKQSKTLPQNVAEIINSQRVPIFGIADSVNANEISINQFENKGMITLKIDELTKFNKIDPVSNEKQDGSIEDAKKDLNMNLIARKNSDGTLTAELVEITIKN